ncbi:MAG: diphthine synthase [Candidatus Hadarchaeia archaeon]
MIIFIGLGLNPTNISLKGLEAAKNSDKIYGDLNTGTLLNDELRYFEEKIDRSVEKMPEADIGEKETQLLKEAKEKDIALLIPGDPMIGTSHSKLRITAAQKNIETKIIHGASIESAAGETGLSLHNFGRSAFLSMPNKAYFVIAGDQKTAYETLKENKESGLHTLLLLDIRTDKKEYLSPGKAISYLLMLEKHINEGALSEKTIILSLS